MSVMDDNGSFDNNEKQIAGMFCQAFENASALKKRLKNKKIYRSQFIAEEGADRDSKY